MLIWIQHAVVLLVENILSHYSVNQWQKASSTGPDQEEDDKRMKISENLSADPPRQDESQQNMNVCELTGFWARDPETNHQDHSPADLNIPQGTRSGSVLTWLKSWPHWAVSWVIIVLTSLRWSSGPHATKGQISWGSPWLPQRKTTFLELTTPEPDRQSKVRSEPKIPFPEQHPSPPYQLTCLTPQHKHTERERPQTPDEN